MWIDLFQALINGCGSGCIYALIGIGFSLIFNVSGVVNFFQGELLALAAFFMFTFVIAFEAGLPLIVSLPLVLILVAAVAMLLEKFFMSPALHNSRMTAIMGSFGLALLIESVIVVVWGKTPKALAPLVTGQPITAIGVAISPQLFLVFASTLIATLALWLFYFRTMAGKAFRACSENPRASMLVGINVANMRLLAYGLSGILGAVAGLLLVPMTWLSADIGIPLAVKGFTAAVLGGVGSVFGSIVGGILLGVLEAVGATFVSSQYKALFSLVILILVLMIRPQGLMGKQVVEV